MRHVSRAAIFSRRALSRLNGETRLVQIANEQGLERLKGFQALIQKQVWQPYIYHLHEMHSHGSATQHCSGAHARRPESELCGGTRLTICDSVGGRLAAISRCTLPKGTREKQSLIPLAARSIPCKTHHTRFSGIRNNDSRDLS